MSNAIARLLTIAIALLPVATLAEPIKLKLAYFSSDREPPYVSVMQPFLEAVNREGKGLIEIVPYSGGMLGRSYAQQAQLVLDGVADMSWVNPSLTPDLFPDDGVLEFPGQFRDLKEATLVHSRMAAAGELRGYGDFFVISAVANYQLMINTRPPIGSLSRSARQDPSRQQPDRGQGAEGNRHHPHRHADQRGGPGDRSGHARRRDHVSQLARRLWGLAHHQVSL